MDRMLLAAYRPDRREVEMNKLAGRLSHLPARELADMARHGCRVEPMDGTVPSIGQRMPPEQQQQGGGLGGQGPMAGEEAHQKMAAKSPSADTGMLQSVWSHPAGKVGLIGAGLATAGLGAYGLHRAFADKSQQPAGSTNAVADDAASGPTVPPIVPHYTPEQKELFDRIGKTYTKIKRASVLEAAKIKMAEAVKRAFGLADVAQAAKKVDLKQVLQHPAAIGAAGGAALGGWRGYREDRSQGGSGVSGALTGGLKGGAIGGALGGAAGLVHSGAKVLAPNAKGVVGTLKGAVGSIKKDPLQAGAHLMNAAVASTPGQAAMGSVAALKNRYGEMMSKDPGRPWGPGTGL